MPWWVLMIGYLRHADGSFWCATEIFVVHWFGFFAMQIDF